MADLQTLDKNDEEMDVSANPEPGSNKQLVKGFNSFDDFIKAGFQSVMAATLASNKLPKGDQWDYYKTFPSFKGIMDDQSSKILELMSLILQHQGCKQNIVRRDLEEKYDLVVEANDCMLERVGINLDEISGIRRNPVSDELGGAYNSPIPVSGSWNRNVTESSVWKEVPTATNEQMPFRLTNTRLTIRPQIKFKDKIDNSSTPFEPRIKEKPNALKPLSILVEDLGSGDSCFSHPYEYELDRFIDRIKSLNLNEVDPCPPRPIEDTPFLYVDNETLLVQMVEDLKNQEAIAVDLEHHSYRSFQGFTCLMQISTREKDYIIDTLELRDKLHVLNEIFTNPKVVKVFHGADSDIQWLQRDLCLYIVNMFDTHQAALQLSLPRLNLAYLLKFYCNINSNKSYQLYDWRTRPLSVEAVTYARDDTHYLLYIYDKLKNSLINLGNGGTQALENVLFQSAQVCKKRYWKYILREDSHLNCLKRTKKIFDNRQMYALQHLFKWRDTIAREEDESVGYVLPNHMLLHIAESLPREMQGILACCNPIPPLVRQNLVTLHQIVLRAREQPMVAKPVISEEEFQIRPALQTPLNLEGPLHCPHDLTQDHDFRSNLPTLLGGQELNIVVDENTAAEKPLVSVFHDAENAEDMNVSQLENLQHVTFMSPYQRYKKVLVYLSEIRDEQEMNEKKKADEATADADRLLQEVSHLLQQQKEVEASGIVKSEKPDENELDECVVLLNENHIKSENSPKSNKKQQIPGDSSGCVEIEDADPDDGKHEEFDEHGSNKPRKKKMKINSDDVMEEQFQNKKPRKEFQPFDYSKVDFNQFQSGQQFKSIKEPKERFKGKGKKNSQFTGKSNNKSFTFSKSGRGRW